jgi:uncharacterized membrane protein YcaP (DUF421 family)
MGVLVEAWQAAMGKDGDPGSLTALQTVARALFLYGFGLVALRLGGHRILGRFSAVDVVVGIMLGSILSRAVNGAAPIGPTLAATAALVAVQRGLAAATCKTPRLARWVKGVPYPLMRDGKVIPKALAAESLGVHDVEEAIRLAGHDPQGGKVERAWLERDGRISVVAGERQSPQSRHASE